MIVKLVVLDRVMSFLASYVSIKSMLNLTFVFLCYMIIHRVVSERI